MNQEMNRKEIVVDLVKEILLWAVVTAIAFMYWIAMLLLASIFLLNIWMTSLEQIVQISIILTVLTSVWYAVHLIRKKRK